MRGAWSACSAACGAGVSTRSLACNDYGGSGGGAPVPAVPGLCTTLNGTDDAAPSVGCFLRACTRSEWRFGDWGACTAGCGGAGTQTRSIACVDTHGNVVPNLDCGTLAPTSQACNRVACAPAFWVASPWTECPEPCTSSRTLAAAGGVGASVRAATCVDTAGGVVDAPRCPGGSAVPATSRACVAAPRCAAGASCGGGDTVGAWGPWGPCSSPCGGGSQSRGIVCWNTTARAPAACGAPPSPPPPNGSAVRGCNPAPCAPLVGAPGSWSACTATVCGSGGGTQSRNASACAAWAAGGSPLGPPLGPAACASAGLPGLATARSCAPPGCLFCDGERCGGRGVCAGGACACGGDTVGVFSGPRCALGGACGESGQLDARGACCPGTVDLNGTCCGGPGAVLDARGLCCASAGGLDACGACGGGARFVDPAGACCADPVPAASGFCCPAGAPVDACGMCGGVGACTLVVSVVVSAGASGAPRAVSLASAAAAALNISRDRTLVTGPDSSTLLELRVAPAGAGVPLGITPSALGDALVGAGAITRVAGAGYAGACGNGACEWGENCAAGAGGACCPGDCPFAGNCARRRAAAAAAAVAAAPSDTTPPPPPPMCACACSQRDFGVPLNARRGVQRARRVRRWRLLLPRGMGGCAPRAAPPHACR